MKRIDIMTALSSIMVGLSVFMLAIAPDEIKHVTATILVCNTSIAILYVWYKHVFIPKEKRQSIKRHKFFDVYRAIACAASGDDSYWKEIDAAISSKGQLPFNAFVVKVDKKADVDAMAPFTTGEINHEMSAGDVVVFITKKCNKVLYACRIKSVSISDGMKLVLDHVFELKERDWLYYPSTDAIDLDYFYGYEPVDHVYSPREGNPAYISKD